MLWDNTGVTVELRDICRSGVDVWAFEYPSYYKGTEKLAFEQLVIDHYFFRQIGQETVGRWLHMFRTRIREIMPYYIQLYESAALMAAIEDPFGNVDVTETYEEERSENSSSQSQDSSESETATTNNQQTSGSSDREHRFSNTPQGSIENLDNYLTEAAVDHDQTGEQVEGSTTTGGTASSTGSASGQTSGTIKHTLHRKGNQGVNTYAHDMKELRETFLNIDRQIIHELNDLFLGVY